MDEPRNEPIFVFADDGLSVFPSLASLLGHIEAPDVESGEYEAIYTIDGAEIHAEAAGMDVALTRTGRLDLGDLQRRVLESAGRFTSDPSDLRNVASEMLNLQWEARWPKRPRWLSRRLHGERPL